MPTHSVFLNSSGRSQLFLYLASKHQLSEATLWRWVSRYDRQGLVGLADQMRKDKGKSRFFEQHPKAATLAAYLFLEQRQSIRAAFEAIRRDCLSLGLKPRQTPSYSTVYAFLTGQAFSEPMKLLAREGRRVYRERCLPYVSRDYSATASNEILRALWPTAGISPATQTLISAEKELTRSVPAAFWA